MRHRAYMINGRYVDAEMFAASIADCFAAGWTLVAPDGRSEPAEVADARIPDGGWGNVTDETGGTPQG